MAENGLRATVQDIRPITEYVVLEWDRYVVGTQSFRQDISRAKLPFKTASVKQVDCHMLLHKIPSYIALMNEINRCLVHGGVLNISVPAHPHPICWDDPMTVRAFSKNTFTYFDDRDSGYRDLGKKYGISPFSMVAISGDSSLIRVRMIK